jgi:iron complex outermembrane receptor protein
MKQKKNLATRARRPELWGCVSLLAVIVATGAAQAEQATPVPDISVTAPPPPPGAPSAPLMDGSAEAGYRVKDETGSGSFWGGLPTQDTPYTVNVVPSQMIQNMQVYTLQDSLKYIPGVQSGNNTQNTTGTSSYVIRGFYSAGSPGAWGQSFEGLPAAGGYEFNAVEDKERVELLQGVNGFLYGVNNVGGNINMVLKRPTATPYFAINLGNNAGDNAYVHADFGGPIDIPGLAEGLFGYRLNIVGQTGDTSYPGQTIQRNLISGAFDIRPFDNLLIQLNASHANFHIWGNTPYFLGSANAFGMAIPTADPSTVRAFPWLQHSDETDIGGVKITWKPNDIFTVRTEWQYTDEYLSPAAVTYDSITNPITGSMTIKDYGGGNDSSLYTHAGYAYLDTKFSVLGIDNRITAGFNGFVMMNNRGGWTSVAPGTVIYPCNYYQQSSCNFVQPANGPYYKPSEGYISGKNFIRNYMIGDEIKIGDKLIILAGGNYAHTGSASYPAPSALATGTIRSPEYSSSALTPTVSVTYKVLPWISAYASYQQSLTPGTVVTNSASQVYTNAGEVLPPYRGTQWEGGVKATVGANMLATLAYFRIDRANLYTQTNPNGTFTYMEGGSQINEGVEFTMSGKLREDLTLYGGFNLINPRVQNNPGSPWQNGQLAQDSSPISRKLYAEYDLPVIVGSEWLHGLTLTGGYSYTGPFHGGLPNSWANIATVGRYPGFAVGDLGFRYATKFDEHPVTLRFTVTNFTNKGYWAAAGLMGAPRTFLASAEFKW